MAVQKHLRAVNKVIRAADLDEDGLDAAIVELARDLARQMDKSIEGGPSARLMASYLSATINLGRAAARNSKVKSPALVAEPEQPVVMTGPVAVEESPLDKLRREKRRTA